MESMSPQDGTMGQSRTQSLAGDSNTKKMKTLAQRRQSAPSLVISKALTRSRSTSRESCLAPLSPDTCPLVQAALAHSPARVFLDHAPVQLRTGIQTQDRHLFIFTDLLLVAKAKWSIPWIDNDSPTPTWSPGHFKVKAQVCVSEMWTAGCMEEVCESSTSPERSFVMGWPTCNCVATFSSEELKDKWLGLIQSRISEEKSKDDPKTVPVKIFAKDIGNCAYAKTLVVSNVDSTTHVIRTALEHFGISGCVKDHRLWVSSCKDDPPYPLIGHEFPFSIKMSHIRDGSAGAGLDPHSPTDCPGVLLMDQCLPPETQCHFILRPSRLAPGQTTLLEVGQQKPFKRKRSLINWPFWKGSNTQLDGAPLSPSLSPTQGRLFGQPLSSVCPPDHSLPKPIMDMLVFLYLEGPYTRGVFRRSAGAKACRELRERLDSGAEDLEVCHESVFVIAAVFKDFLRNIPGSLLCVDVYEQWMEVMEGASGNHRIQDVCRLLHLLPSENLLLLRHVISVLHCIHGNAQENQMNAFNLSVCIAPSMLWAPAPTSPEREGEDTKKVCELVQFLIENCTGVLGEDVTSLFQNFSQKSSGSDHGSDVSSFQMNDSSYDSLENELNDEPDFPYSPDQERGPGLRDKDQPDSHSRDSVLTLSDTETDLLQLPPLARPRKFSPAIRPPRCRQTNGQSHYPRRLRRSSEPVLALATVPSSMKTSQQHTLRKASYDAAMRGEEEEDEVFVHGFNRLQLADQTKGAGKIQNGGQRKLKSTVPPPLHLDASCSSLSSPATSPTGSSLSSLDSAFSQYSDCTGASASDPAPPALLVNGRPQQSPKDSPPQREAPPLTPPRNNGPPPHARRLSLKHTGHLEEEHAERNAEACHRSSSPPSYQQALLQLQRCRSPFFRCTEKSLTVSEFRLLHHHKPSSQTGSDAKKTGSDCIHPPKGVFYGQSTTTLTLQRQKSNSLTPAADTHSGAKTLPRRASEPATSYRPTAKPKHSLTTNFCLSPSATRTVRDYFSSQGEADEDACFRRSQEVALAIVHGKKEWQRRRCSDPRVDEFEQLFFAEESYV